MNSLGAVHQNVGSVGVWTEAPDLSGLGDVILILVAQVTGAELEVVTGVNLALIEEKGTIIKKLVWT